MACNLSLHSSSSSSLSSPSLIDLTASLFDVCRDRVKDRVKQSARPVRRNSASSIKSGSGQPCTHSTLYGTTTMRRGRLTHKDEFVVSGAVDVPRLLYLSRRELYAMARDAGANVLVDEQWSCKITESRFRQNRYTVTIRYSATVARSCWPDAQKPVQLDAAPSVGSGLMTILSRSD